jgi:hypothetical protein
MRPLADCLCASDAAGRGGVRARVFVCLNSAPMGSIRNHQGKRDVQHRRDGLGGGVDHGIIESPCLGKCMHSDSIPGEGGYGRGVEIENGIATLMWNRREISGSSDYDRSHYLHPHP